jgi:hypothetical protein
MRAQRIRESKFVLATDVIASFAYSNSSQDQGPDEGVEGAEPEDTLGASSMVSLILHYNKSKLLTSHQLRVSLPLITCTAASTSTLGLQIALLPMSIAWRLLLRTYR